jgi:hypothetical protein
MSTNDKTELRREKRIPTQLPITVKKDNGSVEEWQGQTRDVSSRGIFMYLSRSIGEGSELELVFPMPLVDSPTEEVWVRCKARVLRVEQADTGDRFGVAAEIEQYERLEDSDTPGA